MSTTPTSNSSQPKSSETYGFQGLTSDEVEASRLKNGTNSVTKEDETFLSVLADLVKEPMLLLLIAASILYFMIGDMGDGLFMIVGIVAITGISLYQDTRSRKAVAALEQLTQPTCKAIREGRMVDINKAEVVVGDYLILEEGYAVPADAIIIQSNDFAVNESILTGESLTVAKSADKGNKVFQGTTVTGGLAICVVCEVGTNTSLGKIGEKLKFITKEDTPLQKQVKHFVRLMAIVGAVIFLLVWGISYLNTHQWIVSLLRALTLAMSIIPEEIPVAFTTFMALGAWRLMKRGIIVRNTTTVEALGSATVICTDKTGTLTENRMSLIHVYSLAGDLLAAPDVNDQYVQEVITTAMWASEPIPFDPMEIAIHDAFSRFAQNERQQYKLIHEYPLGGQPPMMTHIFRSGDDEIIAAKGSPEAIIAVSQVSDQNRSQIMRALEHFTSQGYRVLGVAQSEFKGGQYPLQQQDLPFVFKGLLAFYDPPKANITEVLSAFYKAGIEVKIITGDNAATTMSIARQIHFKGEHALNGDSLVLLDDSELNDELKRVNIFTRMFPEAKLRIIKALKEQGHVVAMTGDGVNDGLALKSAHISIAMGSRGSALAKEVSSLILTDDNLMSMIDAIAMGRRIYGNLKKAIRYIISIHIPIILTVLIPLALGWIYPTIFTPVHVIFLELIMGPTCSIVFENEPPEANAMTLKPRPMASTFFNMRELITSIIQGLAITTGTLFIYRYCVAHDASEASTRAMVFITLISANVFLTLVNRSFYYSVITTWRYPNKLITWVLGLTIALTMLMFTVPPITKLFSFTKPTLPRTGLAIGTGMVSVLWYEFVKVVNRRRKQTNP